MLDIKFIRENKGEVQEAAKNKNIKLDVDRLLLLDEQKRQLQLEIDQLRAKRNEHAKSLKSGNCIVK